MIRGKLMGNDRFFPPSKISGKNKPVVLMYTTMYPPYTGAAPLYFSTLANMLKDKVDFIVFTQQFPGEPTVDRSDPNVWIYRTQPHLQNAPWPVRYVVIPPLTMLMLFYLWRKYKPAAFHIHSTSIFGFVVSLFSSIFKIDLIKEVQDLGDPGFNLLEGHMKKYVATGKTIEKKLTSLGVPQEQILTYYPINPPGREKYVAKAKKAAKKYRNEKGDRIDILFIGWLSIRIKGVDILLEAFKQVMRKLGDKIQLTMIGGGPDQLFCEQYIRDNKLKNVKLLGRVDDETLYAELAKTEMFVMASRTEANPRVILESFLFSKPVIAPKVGGIPELIKSGKNGTLVPPENSKALAKAILDLAENKQLREKYGEEGHTFLEGMPTWEQLADDIYDLYID
jgi:glycosyltransferase involved in cell wall biosynthesis